MAKRIAASGLASCWVLVIAGSLPIRQAPLLAQLAGGGVRKTTFDGKDSLAGWTITGDVAIDPAKGRGGQGGALKVGPGGKAVLKLREADDQRPEIISYRRSTGDAAPRASDYDVVAIQDVETWMRLLARVLPLDKVVEKERALWIYEHTRIHLDRVAGLGDYLELETVVMDIDPEEARAETDRVIYALSLDEADFISVPYRDLVP